MVLRVEVGFGGLWLLTSPFLMAELADYKSPTRYYLTDHKSPTRY